jgi:hypothetical protein
MINESEFDWLADELQNLLLGGPVARIAHLNGL